MRGFRKLHSIIISPITDQGSIFAGSLGVTVIRAHMSVGLQKDDNLRNQEKCVEKDASG